MKTRYRFGKHQNYAVAWEVASPKAAVQILHGIVEHSHRYELLAQKLNQLGYSVYASDHIGHGNTAEDLSMLGVMDADWTHYVEDAYTLTRHIKEKNPDRPTILLGQSMGSFIARACAAKYGDQFDALILTGGADPPRLETFPGLFFARMTRFFRGEDYRSRFLEYITMNKFNALFPEKETKADWLSSDRDEVYLRQRDPYCTFVPTANMYVALVELIIYTTNRNTIRKIPGDLPIFMLSGSEDALSKFGREIKRLDRRMKRMGKRVTTKIYPGSRHELFHDIAKNQAAEDIAKWIEETILPKR